MANYEIPFIAKKEPPNQFGSHFFYIGRKGKGTIPDALRGQFTDERNANAAIETYMTKKKLEAS